jgi:hypothetical protein
MTALEWKADIERPRHVAGVFSYFLESENYSPISTVGAPTAITPPWVVRSPSRAAGIPPINTVLLPIAIAAGGPTSAISDPTVAAGIPAIRTVAITG